MPVGPGAGATSPSRRRVLGAAAAAVGGLAGAPLLAACGGNSGGVSTAGAGGSTGSATSGGAKPAISQWYHEYGEQGVEAAVKRYAAAYPAAKVNVNWVTGGDSYNQKLSAALLGGAGPDVFEYQITTDAVKAGQYVDLTDIIAPVRDDFIDSSLALATVEGKVYGIPMIQDMQLLYYRPSLLQAAGVQPPESLDDLISAAKELTTPKRKGLFVGNDGGAGVLGPLVLFANGAGYTNAAMTKAGFTTPAALSGMAKLRQLYQSRALLLGAPTDWSDPGALINGLTAMQWSGLWALPALTAKFGDDIGVLPFPKDSAAGKASVPVGDYNQIVSAKAKDVDAAKAFVKWLWIDKPEFELDFAQSYGFHIPPRKSVAAKAAKLKTGVAAKVAGFATDLGRPTSPPYWTGAMSTAFTDMMTPIVTQGADPAKAAKAAAQIVDRELSRVSG